MRIVETETFVFSVRANMKLHGFHNLIVFLLVTNANLFINRINVFAVDCLTEYSCINIPIISTSESISCYGIAACANATIINNIGNSSDGRTTRCWSKRACQNVSIFNGSVQYDADIRGFLGLSWSSHIVTHDIACYGEASCINLNNITSSYIHCYAFHACDGAIGPRYFISDSDVGGTGFMSVANAVFFNPIQAFFTGFFTGYNTTVYCQDGYSCQVACYSNGCENVNFICQGDANCDLYVGSDDIIVPNGWSSSGGKMYNDNITISQYFEIYANGYDPDMSVYYQFLETVNDIFRHNRDNSTYILNTSDSLYDPNMYSNNECDGESTDIVDGVQCNDYQECFSDDFSVYDNICCNAVRGCIFATGMRVYVCVCFVCNINVFL